MTPSTGADAILRRAVAHGLTLRYPTPNASTGSPQHTSVEVADPLLWQGLGQVKAKGRTPTPWHRGFSLFLFFFSAVKATCPFNLRLQMGATRAWTCDGIVGPVSNGREH